MSSNFATSNICSKCNICSYEVTYIALQKSYVLALYNIAAKSRVSYVVDLFDFIIMHGGIFFSSKSTTLAPCDSISFPDFSSISTISGILSV